MRTGHAPVTGAGHALERVSEALPEHCLGHARRMPRPLTLEQRWLTVIALPGRVAFQVRPLGATSDGSELSHVLTRRHLTTTNGGSEKIPPCRTNRQGIAKGSPPDTGAKRARRMCQRLSRHIPENFPACLGQGAAIFLHPSPEDMCRKSSRHIG